MAKSSSAHKPHCSAVFSLLLIMLNLPVSWLCNKQMKIGTYFQNILIGRCHEQHYGVCVLRQVSPKCNGGLSWLVLGIPKLERLHCM